MIGAIANTLDRDELRRLVERTDLAALVGRFTTLKSAGRGELRGDCPFCGEGKARSTKFRVKGRRWTCFLCEKNGDAIDFLVAREGLDFLEAVERLGGPKVGGPKVGEKPKERATPAPQPLAHPAVVVSVEARRARDRDADAARAAEALDRALSLWRGAERDGRGVAAYLATRGLYLPPPASLRFVPRLAYWGFGDGAAQDLRQLGAYPAMVAAIQGPDGAIVGLHRTWLDPDTNAKLKPPGDPNRNGAKKILGRHWGGAIRLTEPAPTLVSGEGIETTLSVLAGIGRAAAADRGLAFWAGVSLGNMAGGTAGPSRPHPDGSGRKIPSSRPDPTRPGLLPPPWADAAVLLGDGDSDPEITRARMVCAERRWRAAGCAAAIAWAEPGSDFNDMLRARPAGEGTDG